jgi:cytochrome b
MPESKNNAGRRLHPLWDLPTRLFHWSVVAAVLVGWVSGELGKLGPHMVVGQMVLALLVFRFAWGVVGSSTARFAQFVRGPLVVIAYLRMARAGTPWPQPGHNPLGALSVLALLGLLLLQAATGLFANDDVATDGPLVWLVSSKATAVLSTLHRIGAKLLLALVAVHVSAVMFYLLAKGDNLIRPMLTGVKAMPEAMAAKAMPFRSPVLAAVLLAIAVALVFGGVAVWGK